MNEQKLAQSLLQRRDKGIHPARALLPRTPLSIIATLVCVGLGVFSFSSDLGRDSFALIWLLIGAMVGKHLRDFAWSRDIKNTFPTMHRFIDWAKVETAAKGDDSPTTESTVPSEGAPSDVQ